MTRGGARMVWRATTFVLVEMWEIVSSKNGGEKRST
jgi:hypothetical protein